MTTVLETFNAEAEEAIVDSMHLGARCRVLVCDGEQRTALAVVRSLGRRGHDVAVCSHEIPCIAGISRWAGRAFPVPNPRTGTETYLPAIRMAATAWAADIILPMTDQSNLALLGQREALSPAILPGPSLEMFLEVSDKRRILARARAIGIATPEQVVIESPDSTVAQLGELQGPYAIKAANVLKGAKRYKVLYARDTAELRQELRAAPRDSFPLLVQRRIVGPGVGVFLLFDQGEPIATFAHERVREQPPSGGASVYCRSVTVPPDLIDDAVRLLKAHRWTGAAMVEFKRERTTGIHYLMEVNGRLWGSLQLAIDAGVDFPAMIVDIARGATPERVSKYVTGVALRSFWGDVDHALARIRHDAVALDLPAGTAGRWTALLDFLSWSPRERSETMRFSDPRPFLFDSIGYLSRRIRLFRKPAA